MTRTWCAECHQKGYCLWLDGRWICQGCLYRADVEAASRKESAKP